MSRLTSALAGTLFAGMVLATLVGIPRPQETPSQRSTAKLVPSEDNSARAHLRPIRVVLASPYGPQTEMAPALSAPARASGDGLSIEERRPVVTALDSENLTGALTPAKPIAGDQRTAQRSRSTRAKRSSEQSRDSAMPVRQEFSTSPRDYASSFDERRM
jgi:hypothetical protein